MRSATKRRLFTTLAVGLVLAVLLGVLSGPPEPRRSRPAPESSEGVVTYVYDGDTVEIAGVGKVRLIGIDAMDGYNADRMDRQARDYGMNALRVKRWAGEATAFVRREIEGKSVTLHDGPEHLDDYGRVLAYIHVSGGDAEEEPDLNLLLIRKGLAAAYRRFDHPRRTRYLEAEKEARRERIGLWRDAGQR